MKEASAGANSVGPKAFASEGLLSVLSRNKDVMSFKPFRRQVAALCYRMRPDGSPEFLLLTSRETRRWVIPKGWEMEGKKPHRAAEIESLEEAGIIGEARKKSVGAFCYLKKLSSGQDVPVMAEVYLVRVTGEAEKFKEKGQRDRLWASAHEAADLVREDQLKSLFVRVANELRES